MQKSNIIPLDEGAFVREERNPVEHPTVGIESLQHELAQARLLLHITHELHAMLSSSPPEAFSNALRLIGTAEQVDHAYICSFDLDSFAVDTAFEWRSDTESRIHTTLRGLPLVEFPWLLEQLRDRKTVAIDDVSLLPREARKDSQNWNMLGIKSLLCAPIVDRNRIVGILGLSCYSQPRQWTKQTLGLVDEVMTPIRLALARKSVLYAARSNQSRLSSLLKESPFAIAMFDRWMRLMFASNSWLTAFGATVTDPIGKSFSDFFPSAPKHWIEAQRAALAGAARSVAEDELLTEDGVSRWLQWEVKPWRNTEGEIGGIILAQEDITARKQASEEREQLAELLRTSAEELQKQQAFLRNVIDLNPNYIFAKNLAGQYTLVNKAAAERYGLTVEEMIGKTDFELNLPISDAQRSHDQDVYVAQTAQTLSQPDELVPSAEGATWLQSTRLPLLDDEGNVSQILCVATDVTSRKIAEEQRIALEARMQHAQKLESLGVLAGGIAHDFNNLLMGILGNAGLALMQLSPSSAIHKRVDRVKVAAERAADLTNQLLAYSGKGRFVVEPIGLNKLVSEMLSLLETAISKKCHISCVFSEDLPLIEADATQMRQVVMNLVTNAADSLEDHTGQVFLTTGCINADASYLGSTYLHDDLEPGRYVFLEVADTGKGMTRETLGRIFDPFFTTKFAGRGLGLAGVLGIVRSHRGALKVDSELGRGTTFRVLFPAIPNSPDEVVPDSNPGEPKNYDSKRGLFLVVDDEEFTRTVAKETLSSFGYEVITANDGIEGVEAFTTHAEKLVGVLLDLTMPRMGGEEALSRFRAANPTVPVVLSSGYSELEVRHRIHSSQVAGFLQKPYLPSTLIRKIVEILG